MAAHARLDLEHTQVLLIDMQEKLLPHVQERDAVEAGVMKLLRVVRALEVDLTITEQYPQGLGHTPAKFLEAAGEVPIFSKTAFSAMRDVAVARHLAAQMRPQVLLAGIETHVCVQQTALDLLAQQMQPFVLADAVSSRRTSDHATALDHLRSVGVFVTTVEAAVMSLVAEAGTERFKAVLPIIK
jgi:nicotinamidase-related amidase